MKLLQLSLASVRYDGDNIGGLNYPDAPHARTWFRIGALIINPPKTAPPMWVYARKAMFHKGAAA